MNNYKELAIEFAEVLSDCMEYNVDLDEFECVYCFSKYKNGNVTHEEDCIANKAIEFLKEVKNERL